MVVESADGEDLGMVVMADVCAVVGDEWRGSGEALCSRAEAYWLSMGE